jgi:hypothetical protein
MSQSFWTSLSSYCQELAPVAGPLLAAVGDTADAVDRAGRQTKSLRTSSRSLRADLLATEDDF